jgi:hypothetical protein
VKSQSTSLLVDADTDFESKDGCLAVTSCGSLDSHTIFIVVLGAVFESSVGTENSHHGDPGGFFANLKKIGKIQENWVEMQQSARRNSKFLKTRNLPS